MVTITENTRRITAIRECVRLAASLELPALTGWQIARLSRAYQDGTTEPYYMLEKVLWQQA